MSILKWKMILPLLTFKSGFFQHLHGIQCSCISSCYLPHQKHLPCGEKNPIFTISLLQNMHQSHRCLSLSFSCTALRLWVWALQKPLTTEYTQLITTFKCQHTSNSFPPSFLHLLRKDYCHTFTKLQVKSWRPLKTVPCFLGKSCVHSRLRNLKFVY